MPAQLYVFSFLQGVGGGAIKAANVCANFLRGGNNTGCKSASEKINVYDRSTQKKALIKDGCLKNCQINTLKKIDRAKKKLIL